MMMQWSIYTSMLLPLAGVAVAGWLWSLRRDDVSVVDSLWSLMFLLLAATYYGLTEFQSVRADLVLVLVGLWAVRLSAYIAVRHRGQPEDYRYQAIRRNNEPGFRFKSLYIVFGLQAGLAWLIAVPLAAAMSGPGPLATIDWIGAGLWVVGMGFEAIGDWQLSQFKAKPENAGRVLETGLWRYTRHPNYFGESLIWWGYYAFAVAAGAWWSLFAPLLMTWLLLRVSGVALLEKDIGERRPAYRDYRARTNAFFPGPPRRAA
jgi:steroid 5-alpha reductase family enzyme